MKTANQILKSLDATEIRQRLEDLDKERQALLVLHRAAIRLDRQGKATQKQPATAGGPMRTPRNQSGPLTAALGSVSADEVMPSREFCRRMGFSRNALDALRDRGFPTIECGKQRLVDGTAALAYFRKLAARQSGSHNENAASSENVVCTTAKPEEHLSRELQSAMHSDKQQRGGRE